MMKYFTYIIRKHIHNGFKKEKQTNKQTDKLKQLKYLIFNLQSAAYISPRQNNTFV